MPQSSASDFSAQLRDIPAIIDRLEKSRFNFLDLRVGDLHITLGAHAPLAQQEAARSVPAPLPSLSTPASQESQARDTPRNPLMAPIPRSGQAASATPAGTPVRSPMIGRFYARPEPGAAPFVKIGDRIEADTTIGLIEVMKVFNAVSAGVSGVVVSLLVEDGEFVEFDQVIAYVQA